MQLICRVRGGIPPQDGTGVSEGGSIDGQFDEDGPFEQPLSWAGLLPIRLEVQMPDKGRAIEVTLASCAPTLAYAMRLEKVPIWKRPIYLISGKVEFDDYLSAGAVFCNEDVTVHHRGDNISTFRPEGCCPSTIIVRSIEEFRVFRGDDDVDGEAMYTAFDVACYEYALKYMYLRCISQAEEEPVSMFATLNRDGSFFIVEKDGSFLKVETSGEVRRVKDVTLELLPDRTSVIVEDGTFEIMRELYGLPELKLEEEGGGKW